jgi:hypothetical protein
MGGEIEQSVRHRGCVIGEVLPPNRPRVSCSALVKDHNAPTRAASFKRLLGGAALLIRANQPPRADVVAEEARGCEDENHA